MKEKKIMRTLSKGVKIMNIISVLLSMSMLLSACGATQAATNSGLYPDNSEYVEFQDSVSYEANQEDIENEAEEEEEVEDTPIIYYCSYENCPGHDISGIASSDELPECPPEVRSFNIDITVVGDCMLATYKGQYCEGSFSWYAKNYEPTYFFEKVYDIFSTDDFTIANLENVLTDNNLSEVAKSSSPAYWYKAPTENAKILTANSIEAVSLANNHFGDYGTQGRKDTMAAVEAVGLPYGTNDNTFYLEKNGFKIAVICHGLWNEWQANDIIARINEASTQSDYQIVYYHGGTERIHQPEDWKVKASHKLVDAGADLVIGNHPHVLQPTEVYNGVNIIYSLGNFCFGGSRSPENRTVIYKVNITVQGDKTFSTETSIIPCYVYTGSTNNWQPAPIIDETEKQKVLDFMAGNASLPY